MNIGWNLFRLVLWSVILVWIRPRLLDSIGFQDVAIWLERHTWFRWLGVPPLGLLAMLSAMEPINTSRRRAKMEDLAMTTGGTVTDPPKMDPLHGLPDGPGLSVPIGRWSMTLSRWKRGSRPTTVAKVVVSGASGFSFAAQSAANEPVLLRGLAQASFKFAIGDMKKRAVDAQAMAAVESIDYLASPPITIGHDSLDRLMVLRSNRPDLARALFLSSGVARAIEALDSQSKRWNWTLQPSGTGGAAEMRLECPGALADAEALGPAKELLQAALDHLHGQRVVAA